MKARFIAIAALALLATACSKDNDGTDRLRIYAENMSGTGGAKVWVNPSNTDNANSSTTWVTGEQISLSVTSGVTTPTIAKEGDDFYLNTGETDITGNKYAIYPATTTTGGNDITVTNNGSTGGTVVIKSLAVNFRSISETEGHDILFPMAAATTDGKMRLLFNHLTAALQMKLTNNSGSSKTLGSLKVVTYGDSAAAGALPAVNGVTCTWEHQGPVLPNGEIGSISGDPGIGYASEMHFTIKDNGSDGKTVASSSSIYLCVPLTVNEIKTIEVTGYDASGAQLFCKKKTLDTKQTITVNHMYPLTEITF